MSTLLQDLSHKRSPIQEADQDAQIVDLATEDQAEADLAAQAEEAQDKEKVASLTSLEVVNRFSYSIYIV